MIQIPINDAKHMAVMLFGAVTYYGAAVTHFVTAYKNGIKFLFSN